MARLPLTCACFGFAALAGATPFVMPWPVAAITSGALLVLYWAVQEERDLDVASDARRGRGGRSSP